MQRWTPSSEDDINAAIANQTLGESHYLDCKREIKGGSGANKELARDLASFAPDSGGLLIGVEEDKAARGWSLYPVPLAGLAERIEQVAQQTVDPPLFVIPHVIPTPNDSTLGYVFVEVPGSAVAPHMVDGIYYGRGDSTRARMSDAEVLRYHSRRTALEDVGERLLDEEIRREPVPEPHRKNGHMYLVAQPVTGHASIAQTFVRGRNGPLLELLREADAVVPAAIRQYAPAPDFASEHSRRAAGSAMSSYGLSTGRAWSAESREDSLIDIEFREDGGIRVLVGRMTAYWAERQVGIINDGLAVAYALRLSAWAARLGDQVGYRGAWVLGFHGSALQGLLSSIKHERIWGDSQAYDAESYRAVTTAPHIEMVEKPGLVAERLVGRLVRGLGSWGDYGKFLSAEDDA